MSLLTPRYSTGQRFLLEVETIRDRDKSGSRSIQHVALEVEEARESETLLTWRPEWSELLEGSGMPEIELDAELVEEIARQHFEIVLDAEGRLLGIVNQEEIQAVLARMIDAVAGGMNLTAAQREQMDRILTPQMLFTKFQRPVSLYFGFSGRDYEIDHSYSGKVMLPTVTGATMPADLAIEVKAGPGADEFTVLSRMESSVAPLMALFGEQLAGVDLAAVRLLDLTESIYDLENGCPALVRFTRSASDPRFEVFDYLEIRLIGS